MWRIRVFQFQLVLEENGLKGNSDLAARCHERGPFQGKGTGVQDRDLGGATPALVRVDLQPVQNSAVPPNTMSSSHSLNMSLQNPPRNLAVPHSGRTATSKLTEQGQQEGLTSDKKQSRFLGSAMRCHTDRCTVAKTLPQRPLWNLAE